MVRNYTVVSSWIVERIFRTIRASSVRENETCAEAWVWTLPDFQRRGYARQVTSAWAQDLQVQGKLPFYSHKLSNVASAAVARSLGLIDVATAVAYE